MPTKTLLIDARRATTLPDLLSAIAGSCQPTPHNLDAFADFLRESRVNSIVLRGCRLTVSDYTRLANVCSGEGVKLHTN